MKIVCDSCSAKYSIADEKVAGRVFKIRCKKCGSAIVVRGDQVDAGDSGEEAATRVADYGGDAVWHAVVDGDQQGPFSPAQIGEMLAAGTIGWDVFVWREGFDDWKPAQDVEELVQAVMGGGGDDAAAEAAAAGGGGMGADPFAAAQSPEEAGPFGGSEAAVANRSNDVGADLFAQTEAASPFGAAGGDDEDDVVASAPSPRVSADQALTGARNENSVLFSLSNLQALATGPSGSTASSAPAAAPSSPSSGGPRPGMASGEGSGLIDIRALASATGVAPGSGGPVTSGSNDKVDDLLSIGGAGAGGLGSSLGAPVLIPERKEESNKGVLIGAGVAVVAALAIAAGALVFVMSKDDAPETSVGAVGSVPPGATVNAAGATAPAAAPAPGATAPAEGAAAQPAAPAAPAAAAAEPEEAAGDDSADEEDSSEDSSGGGHARRRHHAASRGASGGGGSAHASSGGGSHEPSGGGGGGGGGSHASRGGGGGGGDIDSLLNQALSNDNGGGGSRRRSGGSSRGGGSSSGGGGGGSGPPTPSRGDVVGAMNSVSGAVSACGNGQHGVAPVRIVFSGRNGHVTNANVQGNLPPPVRTCIARAVRGAHVPPFSQPTFSINYPFRL